MHSSHKICSTQPLTHVLCIFLWPDDQEKPVITCPSSYEYELSDAAGGMVDYTANAATAVDGAVNLEVTYDPPVLNITVDDIGSFYVVTASAKDADGYEDSCKFMIKVKGKLCLLIRYRPIYFVRIWLFQCLHCFFGASNSRVGVNSIFSIQFQFQFRYFQFQFQFHYSQKVSIPIPIPIPEISIPIPIPIPEISNPGNLNSGNDLWCLLWNWL